MKNVITVAFDTNERALMISVIDAYLTNYTKRTPIRLIYRWIKIRLMMAKEGSIHMRMKKINAVCLAFALALVKEKELVMDKVVDEMAIDRIIGNLLDPLRNEEGMVVA